jgi:hypothetical protein
LTEREAWPGRGNLGWRPPLTFPGCVNNFVKKLSGVALLKPHKYILNNVFRIFFALKEVSRKAAKGCIKVIVQIFIPLDFLGIDLINDMVF